MFKSCAVNPMKKGSKKIEGIGVELIFLQSLC